MLRSTIFLYFLAIFAQSAPIPYNLESDLAHVQTPDSLQITKEDKDILMELAMKHKVGDTQDDIFRALKAKSEVLYEKMVKVRTIIRERFDALDEDAQNFVKNCIAEVPNLMKARSNGDNAGMMRELNKLQGRFANLPEGSRASLQQSFVFLSSIGLSV